MRVHVLRSDSMRKTIFFSRSKIVIHFSRVCFLWLLVLFPYAYHESMPYMPWHDIHVIHNLWLYYIIIRKPLLCIVKCNLAFAFYFCFPCFYLWIMCINWWFPLCFGVNSEITNPQNYSFFLCLVILIELIETIYCQSNLYCVN